MSARTYLLDTNIISYVAAEHPLVQARLDEISDQDSVITCVIVAGEVRYGLERMPAGKRKRLFARKMHNVLSQFACVPVPIEADAIYATLKSSTERKGKPLGENDLWIAATALVLSATLVTADTDFFRHPSLPVENWAAPPTPLSGVQ